jgi:hypothetical protein
VGYGDYYPRTTPGRIVVFLCSIVGVVVVSLVVVSIINRFTMSDLESKAYTVINKIELKKKMKEKASKIISKLCRLHLKVKNNEEINLNQVYELNNINK